MYEKFRCLLILTLYIIVCVKGGEFQFTMNTLIENSINDKFQNFDDGSEYSEFDFIIVGAGTAGSTLANRLSENTNWMVLLIEAGGHENLDMDVPLMAGFNQMNERINWGYRTQSSNLSCLAFNESRCMWPSGRVLGGSSALNYMIHTRGNRRDYDRWAELGNTGWGFDDVLPYFKKLEHNKVPNLTPDYAGKGGPLTISQVKWKSKVAKAFLNGAREMGIPSVDYNGPTQIGVSYLQTTTKKGLRVSSNTAYLFPINDRPNLFVLQHTQVTKILIDKETKTAKGVQYNEDYNCVTILARKEVIVSAGAINSPQLLMLSGIGPEDHLNDMNINPIVNLTVGYNLMDHTAPGALTFTTNMTTLSKAEFSPDMEIFLKKYKSNLQRSPAASTAGCESLVFLDLEHSTIDPNGWPDIELLQTDASVHSSPKIKNIFGLKTELYSKIFGSMEENGENGFMIYPIVLRPKSRGYIELSSSNPLDYPLIYPNYFSDPNRYDMNVSVAAIKKTIEFSDTPAFKKINAKLHKTPIPACEHHNFGTDAYWECYTKYYTFTLYDYSGTCKMGPENDPTAVVDPQLRVKGIKRLRVVDASIFPEIIAGHINSAVYMIAEKAADMIKNEWIPQLGGDFDMMRSGSIYTCYNPNPILYVFFFISFYIFIF